MICSPGEEEKLENQKQLDDELNSVSSFHQSMNVGVYLNVALGVRREKIDRAATF
jgi:hypothetical protein